MKKEILIILTFLFGVLISTGQNEYLDAKAEVNEKVYSGASAHEVKAYTQNFKKKKPKNIILLIGDGMGFSQLHAGFTANRGNLYITNIRHMGMITTFSADKYITDSAAGGSAFATGQKTKNGAISVNDQNEPVQTILQEASLKGLATGLVSTSAITHATPASFIAHQPSRNMYEEIAADFLNTDVDVFIGGGYKHFTERKDGRNLVNELKQKGYNVEREIENIKKIKSGKLAGLTAAEHNGRLTERGDMLPVSTTTAINILDKNKKGFFLMVEGSQIDWGGHAGSTIHVVEDLLDFDQAVGVALEFASKDKETLVIVTSDHETGGMVVLNGNYETGMVKGEFTTGGHTGQMVPLFAFGPGSQEFLGVMDNTDVHDIIKKLLLNE